MTMTRVQVRFLLLASVLASLAICERIHLGLRQASAAPAAATSLPTPSTEFVRVDGLSNTTKPERPMGPAAHASPAACVAAAYDQLASEGLKLVVQHGSDTPAFHAAYAAGKVARVSDDALRVAGCIP